MIQSVKAIATAVISSAILMTNHEAAAETYYVRTDGNNSNVGLSNASSGAWKTLKYAFSRLQAGDKLLVANGTYSEFNLALNFTGGSKSLRTTIQSINKWGARIVMDADYHGLPINSNGVILDGLEMTWAPNPAKEHKGIEIYGNWTTVKNCHVYGIPFSGISGAYCDNVLIEYNVVHDNYTKDGTENGSGISIWDPHMVEENTGGYNIIIRNNIVYHNWATNDVASVGFPSDGNGIIIDDFRNSQTNGTVYTYKTLVENNLCFDNGAAGISVYSSDNVTVRNNTCWYNNWVLNGYGNSAQISNTDGSNNEFYNNIAVVNPAYSSKTAAMSCKSDAGGVTKYNNNVMCGGWTQFDTWNSNTTITSGTNSGNVISSSITHPEFVNPTASTGFDFHLEFTSPVINAGYNTNAAVIDLEGRARPVGSKVEPGCYEYSASTDAQPWAVPSLGAVTTPGAYGNLFSVDGRRIAHLTHLGLGISRAGTTASRCFVSCQPSGRVVKQQ